LERELQVLELKVEANANYEIRMREKVLTRRNQAAAELVGFERTFQALREEKRALEQNLREKLD